MHKTNKHPRRIHRYLLALIVLWTVVAAVSLVWNLFYINKHTLMEARSQARAIYDKDIFYRRWNAGHGGIYVRVTDETRPNPYLSHISNRDITTKSGELFTLVNPAYMTRQVHELMDKEKFGLRGHITSLKLRNPINKPDTWETKALEAFEKGEIEVSSLEKMEDGSIYMRLMRPMITEEPCLKCHADQGYKVGDVRGGVSVSVPMTSRIAIQNRERNGIIVGHGIMWFLGLTVVTLGGQKQKRDEAVIFESEERRGQVLEELNASNMQLIASEMQLKASNQQLRENEEQLRAEIAEREKMSEEREKHLRDLEVFYKANIGREERVLELKNKIEELEEKQNKK